jgi:hypothetical protein
MDKAPGLGSRGFFSQKIGFSRKWLKPCNCRLSLLQSRFPKILIIQSHKFSERPFFYIRSFCNPILHQKTNKMLALLLDCFS